MPEGKRQRPGAKRTTTKASQSPSKLDFHGFLDAIVAGNYDDRLRMIQAAIDDRREARQGAVMEQVKEVFGDDYDVVPRQRVRPAPRGSDTSDYEGGEAPEALPQAAPSQEGRAPGSDALAESPEESTIESRGARFDVAPGESPS